MAPPKPLKIVAFLGKDPVYSKTVQQVVSQEPDLAGNHRAARQVVRVLHSWSKKEGLPWHRVINGKGKISLKPGRGFELQKSLLEAEGVTPNQEGIIDLSIYLWQPTE